ncbi:hypothetical protein BFL38_04715 [Brachyspira hampsonii]|uniref:Uncharacterized protein n=1 Tax=Brachyspira hampsonii TaxID=1287055 RepID=A0A1E5NCY5_9SPIR|nr:hypothetical protein [Brachyspira hampsonii]OEJ14040.1 hypothetical protein BFL38_04715 [Brachyspira hampsonii]
MEQYIINNLPDILKNNIDTLKNTSKDFSNKNNIQYMTESKINVINFDKVVIEYKNKYCIENLTKSNDALYISNENYYFIEFKNGKLKNNIIQFNGKMKGEIKGQLDINQYINTNFEGNINGILFYINGTIENNKFSGYVKSTFNGHIDGSDIDNNNNIKSKFNGTIKANLDGYINYINIENDLKEKIYDSIFILSNISKELKPNIIESTKNNTIYILVYNEKKNSTNKIWNNVKKQAKQNTSFINFPRINNLKNYILKDINYYTEKEFDNFIEKEFI